MAVVRPLRALRYNDELCADLAPLLAPPYDVIKDDEQQALYDKDVHNIIRLEYGLQSTNDTVEDNRYTRARATLAAWLADNTLVMEARPAFYPHVQQYDWEGQMVERRGFFAAVELQRFDEGDILPHEWTLKGPKEDRLRLMRTCHASFSPIFGLYDGRHTEIGELLERTAAAAPLAVAAGCDYDDRLWRMDDPTMVAALSEALSKRQILIADGHHRYETMLALRDILREQFPAAPLTAAFNYVLMTLVDINDPGLLVLPTHRLLLATHEMLAAAPCIACESFRSEPIDVPHPDAVTILLAKHRDEHAFIVYRAGGYTLLTAPKTELNGLPVLDVTALQERILTPLFSHDPGGQATVERNVRYTIKPTEAVARVDSGEAGLAIFLNPTPVPDVLTLAARGIRLPQKSTYFYPKLPTGLVMHNLQPEVTVG